MAQCPACRRPVAMARPVCLYCGAALPAEAVAAAAQSALAVASADRFAGAAPARTLVVVDVSAIDARTLGAALGLTPYESAQRTKRGGYALEGVLDEAAAEEEAARLRGAGLDVFLISGSATRVDPWLAVAGVREESGLRLRGATGSRLVSGSDLLLVVRGPIVREPQAPLERRKIPPRRLEDGYRFHLHLRGSREIVELDPGDFDFGARGPLLGSSLLEMSEWLGWLASGVLVDEAFRHATPALGPSAPGPSGPLAATNALAQGPAKAGSQEPTIHDNLRQFRFYSSWRGAVEHAKAGQG